MKNILKLKLASNSLFVRLLFSFLIIIILLVSFNFITFNYFKNNIHEEIITYNTQNVNNTVKNYEDHFKGIVESSLVLSIHGLNDTLYNQIETGESKFSYLIAKQMIDEINYSLINSNFRYLDELMIVFKNNSLLINKDGLYSISSMFSEYIVHPDFQKPFWEEQFKQDYQFKIFPNQSFLLYGEEASSHSLFPIVIRHQMYKQMYIVAFLDANKIFKAEHQSINYKLMILDESREKIFSTVDQNMDHLQLEGLEGTLEYKDYYYFYKKGSFTNFTYVNIIPTSNVNAKLIKLNVILLSLLFLSIIISISVSVFFSMKLNNPIKKIVASIQQFQSFKPIKTNIKEFDLINHNLSSILNKQHDMSKSLKKRNSLIMNYAYSNKLKNLNTNVQEIKDLNFSNRPFMFILFELSFKFQNSNELDKMQATNFLRESINHFISQKQPNSSTFQIETQQILSLVFTNQSSSEVISELQELKNIFDHDTQYYFFTIAVSETFHHSSHLTIAYEKTLKLLKQRKLNELNQIVFQPNANVPAFLLTPNQEQEFHLHLLEGNQSAVLNWVNRHLNHLYRKEAYAWQFQEFSMNMINKVNQTMHSLNLGNDTLLNYHDQLNFCNTLDQYLIFFEHYITTATALIKQKKEEHDYISSFVIDYIEEHYFEDISLDILAEKLKMSKGYLSTYFKEKTGINFIDYLNEFRITKSKLLLSDTNVKIQEIAEQVGYLNSSSFFRMFKRITGVTPGEYRQKYQN